jgi:hypothetical protein
MLMRALQAAVSGRGVVSCAPNGLDELVAYPSAAQTIGGVTPARNS